MKGRSKLFNKKCPNCGTKMEYVSISFSYCPHCRIRRKNPPEFITKIKYERKERKKLEKQVKIWTNKNTSQEELRKLAGGRAFLQQQPFSFQDSTGDGGL